jgi:hypothetical protein
MIDIEDINEVPEKYREQYVEVKEGDKTLWRNKGFIALKEVSEKYKTKASEFDSLKGELSAKAEKAEADRIEALREKGDFKTLLDDATAKLTAAQERAQARDKLVSSKAKQSLISGLGDMFTDVGRATGSRLLDSMVNFDPETEKYTFFDESGGALTVDEKGFRSYIEKSALFAPLVAAEVSTGGQGRNSVRTTNTKNMTSQQKIKAGLASL